MLIYAAANQGYLSTSFIASQHNRMKLVLERPCIWSSMHLCPSNRIIRVCLPT